MYKFIESGTINVYDDMNIDQETIDENTLFKYTTLIMTRKV